MHDVFDNPKAGLTARAFRNGVLVSTVATTTATPTNSAGSFVLILPGNTPNDGITLELVLNPDILAEVAARTPRPFVVGFAAETDDMERYARGKLERKKLDMIAANHVGAQDCGFDSERKCAFSRR